MTSALKAKSRGVLPLSLFAFTGILACESATSVTIRKEKGEEAVIFRKDIAIIKASDLSLMPSNLHEQVTPQDLGH